MARVALWFDDTVEVYFRNMEAFLLLYDIYIANSLLFFKYFFLIKF